MGIRVHRRVHERHPEIEDADVLAAWKHRYYEALRVDSPNFPEYLWIGRDERNRELEMVGTITVDGWLIYHANTPLSKRTRAEIKRNERRNR